MYEDSYAHTFAVNNDLLYVIFNGTDFIEVYKVDGVTYYIIDGEAVAVSCDADVTEVTIPATVEGYPVVELRETFKEHKNIQSVILPEGLKLIGEYAFYFATKLKGINIPSTVTELANYSFTGCYDLTELVFPEGLKTIGNSAFLYCSGLTKIEFPKSLISIGSSAFSGCEALEKITVTGGVTTISSSAFSGCENLTHVSIASTVTTIGSGAFANCAKLRVVTIPETVTSLKTNSFSASTILVVAKDSYAHTFAVNNNLLYFVLQKAENPEIAYGAAIEGTVTMPDGTAAAGATVEILYTDGTLKESVIADANGKYTFTYAEVGEYIIRANNGKGATATTVVAVKRMNVFDVFVSGDTAIVLKDSYTVSGSVNGAATVTVKDFKGNVIASATTNGTFSFANIPNGEYLITAESTNGFASTEIVVFGGNVSGVTLTLEVAGISVWGYVEVEDRDGNTERKNWVDVSIYDTNGTFIASAKSDSNGKYIFNGLTAGAYSIVAKTSQMRPDEEFGYERNYDLYGYGYVEVVDGIYQADTIILSEDRGNRAELAGKVTATGQTQVSEIVLRDVFGNEVATYNTGNNGKYKFKNIADGLYFITATTESDGMGYAVVLVRDGEVYGDTDIKVLKSDKVKVREQKFADEVPELNVCNNPEAYRSRIADEKRFYDGLSEKEKRQLSKSYVEKLTDYVEWLTECEYNSNDGVKIEQGGLVVSGDELENGDDISFTVTVEKQEQWQNNGNGVNNAKDHINHAMKDKANGNLVQYYEITMTKTADGEDKAITSVYKDTEAAGKFRITLPIPQEFRGYVSYSIVHVHNGEVTTLVDLDDNPDTITIEVDKFSTFALLGSEVELTGDPDEGIDPEKHTAAEAVIENKVDATCTTDGSYDSVIYCSVCQEELSRETCVIEKLDHNYYSEWVVDVAPTCATVGSKSHHCTRCDDKIDITEIPANGHSWGNWYEIQAPTCTATGVEERKCSMCQAVETTAIKETGHKSSTPVVENRVEATCTVDGSYDSVVYCSVCQAEMDREEKIIAKLNHNEILHSGKAATCTTLGWEEYVTCSRCDYTTYKEIAALDHAKTYHNSKSPTCTENGWEEYVTCSRCEYSTYVELPATGHKASEWIIDAEATYEANGLKHKECTACGTILEESIVPMLSHNYTSVVTLPTCTEQGYTTHTCSDCGNSYVDDYTPANGHSWGDWYETEAPSCTATGVEEHKCSACQATDTRTTAAKGHKNSTPVVENRVEATCTVDGSYDSVIYCSVCNAEISRENMIIAKLGHNYSIEWTVDVAPTCTTVGSASRHCTKCDHKVDVTEIVANGHGWGNWHEIQAPTCTQQGIEQRECVNCSQNEQRDVSALGHQYSSVITPPTCTEQGYTTYGCSCCNEGNYVGSYVDALGHSFTNYVSNNDATYTEDGTKTAKCDRCDEKNTIINEGSALGMAQKFCDEMERLSQITATEIGYSELYAALQSYAAIPEDEKGEASEDFATLQQMINAYNSKAQTANNELAESTKVAFAPLATTSFAFLAALWFLLRKKFLV